jgi:hypothetical protein
MIDGEEGVDRTLTGDVWFLLLKTALSTGGMRQIGDNQCESGTVGATTRCAALAAYWADFEAPNCPSEHEIQSIK